jgi:hypothetical protein
MKRKKKERDKDRSKTYLCVFCVGGAYDKTDVCHIFSRTVDVCSAPPL